MTLEDLQAELKKDLVLDMTQLQTEAAENINLYCKWSTKYSNIRKSILSLDAQRKKRTKTKLDYYSGRGDEVSMDRYERSEMKTVLSGDADILTVETKIQYFTIMLEFCGNAMDAIKSRGFAIKNIIDLRQFEAGK